MEIGRELIEQVFRETAVEIRVGGVLHASNETVLNYLVLARSIENDDVTVRWDGTVRVSPRLTIAADEHASINLRDFYGDEEKVPSQFRDLSIVFRSAYLKLDDHIQRQHIGRRLDEAIPFVKNVFDRITSHRSKTLVNENNALIIAPNEFVWPVSVLKYVSEIVGDDFRSFRRFSPF